MGRHTKVSAFALALMAGSASLFAGSAWAQTKDVAAKQADAASTKVEEVVVTGSRVRRSNLTEPTPLTVLSTEQIRFSGYTSLGQVLNQLTQVSPSTNNQNTGLTLFATGSQTVDIRGLGSARTLVLVNGKRHQAGIFTSSAVDLNSFATNYIEKTEVITGGASATYGSEAISGVVNLITRKDLEGIELNTTAGVSDKGDGSSCSIIPMSCRGFWCPARRLHLSARLVFSVAWVWRFHWIASRSIRSRPPALRVRSLVPTQPTSNMARITIISVPKSAAPS
jgi:outer membrane cobalamin receptor